MPGVNGVFVLFFVIYFSVTDVSVNVRDETYIQKVEDTELDFWGMQKLN